MGGDLSSAKTDIVSRCKVINDQLYVAGGWDGRRENDDWIMSPEVWTISVKDL